MQPNTPFVIYHVCLQKPRAWDTICCFWARPAEASDVLLVPGACARYTWMCVTELRKTISPPASTASSSQNSHRAGHREEGLRMLSGIASKPGWLRPGSPSQPQQRQSPWVCSPISPESLPGRAVGSPGAAAAGVMPGAMHGPAPGSLCRPARLARNWPKFVLT